MEQTEKDIEKRLVTLFSKDRVDAWRKQFGKRKLNIIEVEDAVAVLQPITADEIAHYSMMVTDPEGGLVNASRYILETLWLDGDERIKEDEDYFISAMLQVQHNPGMRHLPFDL